MEKNNKDYRPESYRPIGAIKSLSEPIGTANNWEERKRYILTKELPTMCWLEKYEKSKISLGIIKPSQITDFIIEDTSREWNEKQRAQMNQMRIFDSNNQILEKIPFKFSYTFYCSERGCKGHTKMIIDWELGALYRKMRDKYDETIACEKIKQKYFCQMCATDIDTHFFVGTLKYKYAAWIVLGVFWPKKEQQLKLL